MNNELMRIIDSISRDKNIERESLVDDIEIAMAGALRKQYEEAEDVEVRVDLLNGEIQATVDGEPVSIRVLGRIAIQAAKQMIIQKTRDRERASIYDDFTGRRGTIVTGTVIRAEGGNLLVNIGRTEGFLPRSEQIPGETHQPGERLRALILEVRDQPNQVKVILSRANKEFIERLFELEVPEVAEHIIEIKALAREAGYRSKVAVSSIDSKVDAVGACVGVRGSRIKNIVDELGGEKIDIVRWNESSQILIQNALKPAEVQEIALCFELGKATVVVGEDQLSLAIGKRGQNVRLAARLTGWDVDILTPAEYNKHLETVETTLKRVEGVDDVLVDKLIAFGCVSVFDIDEIGPDPLVNELEIEADLAARVVEEAGEEVIHIEEQREAQAKAEAEGKKLAAATPESTSAVEPSAFVPAEESAGDEAAAAAAAATAGTDTDEAVPNAEEAGVATDAAEATPEAEAVMPDVPASSEADEVTPDDLGATPTVLQAGVEAAKSDDTPPTTIPTTEPTEATSGDETPAPTAEAEAPTAPSDDVSESPQPEEATRTEDSGQ